MSALRLSCPPGQEAAKRWIARTLLTEGMGLPLEVSFTSNPGDPFTLKTGDGSRSLLLGSHFWGQTRVFTRCIDGIPFASATAGPELSTQAGGLAHADLLGSSAWLLSRAEELGQGGRDPRKRFLAQSSWAARSKCLDRPVVDEACELLRRQVEQCLGVQTRPPVFQIALSHDVDEPFRYRATSLIRSLARGWKDHGFAGLLLSTQARMASRPDPYDTFEALMDLSESSGKRSTFFFLTSNRSRWDAPYALGSPDIQELMQRILKRGHSVGLHGSYGSFECAEYLLEETESINATLGKLGGPPVRAARQHYLRWSPLTPGLLSRAGIAEDHTLGYGEAIGFRASTCRPYGFFSWEEQREYPIRIHPLIAMDATLLSKNYLGLSIDAARTQVLTLKERCRQVGGTFSLLWHNNNLVNPAQTELYSSLAFS